MTLAAAFLSLLTSAGPAGLAPPPDDSSAVAPAAETAPVQLASVDSATLVPVPDPSPIVPPAASGPTPASQEHAPAGHVAADSPDWTAPIQRLLFALRDERDQPAEPSPGDDPAPAATSATPPNERGEPPPTPVEQELIPGRRRPDIEREHEPPVEQDNPGAIRSPPPEAFPAEHIVVPDRWRLIQSLGIVTEHWWDPYHQNTLKGDRPICIPTDEEQARRREAGTPRCATPRFLGLHGQDWFFVASAVSDTVVEPRSFPIPVGAPDQPAARYQRRVRQRRQHRRGPDLHLLGGAGQGLDRVSAARCRMAADAGRPGQLRRRARAARPRRTALAGSNRFDYASACRKRSSITISGTRRIATISIAFVSAFSRSTRFPRVPLPGPAAGHPAVRQPRQQPLPVQPGGDLAAGEGHQFRAQQPVPDAARRLGPARQSLSAGLSDHQCHERTQPHLEQQPRARPDRGRRQRLPGPPRR